VVRSLPARSSVSSFRKQAKRLLRLRLACLSGDAAAVRRIVGARPESMQDAAALIGAAQQGRLEIVRLLLDLGFAVDALGQGGETALHQAANAGHLPVVRELVERGASLAIREQTHGEHLWAGPNTVATRADLN
jgi:hypothetical protein